ncbi:hypothetical protein [Cellulosimicrobium arenosum]|uniref:Uncharacterized protein n=1 Tax=Cellulosimicrobium arenosum TaxID=2708133 RepID=A0A927IZE2_9MICO|nr:hypothetical protein [Cellulosimicrobium arenosum]MBD8078473.1 hypothetical protein [Cellulosimicrobium arenosum]
MSTDGHHADALGDDAVAVATGQPRESWFTLLDAHGASTWSQERVAAWLIEKQGVDGWWAQSLTVAYGQARGVHAPGNPTAGS